MIATLLLSAAMVAQLPVSAQVAPKTETQTQVLAPVAPASIKRPRTTAEIRRAAKERKKQLRTNALILKQRQAAVEQIEYERRLPAMLKEQEILAKQQQAVATQVQTNALIRSAAAQEANARANAQNAVINRQRLLREQYPQFYGGR